MGRQGDSLVQAVLARLHRTWIPACAGMTEAVPAFVKGARRGNRTGPVQIALDAGAAGRYRIRVGLVLDSDKNNVRR
jgi:hypothetical protein